jgi:type I restriction enzyme S subunit
MSTETTHIETEKQLVPALRFRGFDSEWKKSTLKKEAIVNPRTNELPEKFIYIDLESVKKGMLVKEEEICLSEAPSRAQRLLDKDDILYQTVRPYQKNNLYFDRIGDYVASTGYAQIKAKGDSKYLFQFLHTTPFVNVVNRWSTGTSYPAINPSELVKIQVAFPTLPEQQKIASFLAAVDEKIQQLTKKKALLEEYKKGVMQQLFSGQLRFKDENGEAYPDWEEKRLGEVLTIGSGRDHKHLESGDIPVFGTGGYMRSVNKKLYSGETVFIGRKGTIDKPFYFDGDFWTVDTLFYTHKFKNVLPKFIYAIFQQVNWKLHNEASGVPSLSKSTIEKIKFDFPSIEEQQKIATYVSRIDTKIESVNNQITQTQTFKKGLLQQLFV